MLFFTIRHLHGPYAVAAPAAAGIDQLEATPGTSEGGQAGAAQAALDLMLWRCEHVGVPTWVWVGG